ncbi:hypothetical protein AADG42_14690 [Ammonicoccus fulvus]|uniref:Uncharacterized protein n=1 Tax=Ammonicoccus fulvus TaxID=3138240 RepID=A0ABZ3FTK3_9ACTN
MPSREQNPLRQYGVLAGPATFAPGITAGAIAIAVLALIATVVMIATPPRTVMVEGAPGAPIAIESNKRNPVVATDAPVDPSAVTCTITRADGTPARAGVDAPRTKPYEIGERTWYPVADLSIVRDGDTVTCSGQGLGNLHVTWNSGFDPRLYAIAGWVGAVVAGLFSAFAWAARRASRTRQP